MSTHTSLLIACLVIAAVSIPLMVGVVPPNRLYGFRTPRTLSDRVLWYRANHFAGWAFFVAALAGAVLLLERGLAVRDSSYDPLLLVVPVGIALAVSLFYLRKIAGEEARDDG